MSQNKALGALKDLEECVQKIYQKKNDFFCKDTMSIDDIVSLDLDKESITVVEPLDEKYMVTKTYSWEDYLESRIEYTLKNKIENFAREYGYSLIAVADNSKQAQHHQNFFVEKIDDTFNSKVLSDFKFLSKYKNELLNEILKYSNIFTSKTLAQNRHYTD